MVSGKREVTSVAHLKHPFPNGRNCHVQLLKMRLGALQTSGCVPHAAQSGGWSNPPSQPGQSLFGPLGLAYSVVLLQTISILGMSGAPLPTGKAVCRAAVGLSHAVSSPTRGPTRQKGGDGSCGEGDIESELGSRGRSQGPVLCPEGGTGLLTSIRLGLSHTSAMKFTESQNHLAQRDL